MSSICTFSHLEQEGRSLVERLGGRWGVNGGLCRCPAHDDRTPSLSVRPGRRRLLFHCFAGCDARTIMRALSRAGLTAPNSAADDGVRRDIPAKADFREAALRLWGAALPVGGTPAAAYLSGRELAVDGAELRYHPRTPHGPRPLTRYRPALVAAVRDESGLIAVHRTFLAPRDATGAVHAREKRGLGPFGRGAVRLGGVARRLGLAEGIESALSAAALFGLPCWATLGTERFASVALPACVGELLLFLDNDAGGRRAEALARAAYPHLAIEARYPPRTGEDWNDALIRARKGEGTGDG
jgi:putative DNA primase/helicase